MSFIPIFSVNFEKNLTFLMHCLLSFFQIQARHVIFLFADLFWQASLSMTITVAHVLPIDALSGYSTIYLLYDNLNYS